MSRHRRKPKRYKDGRIKEWPGGEKEKGSYHGTKVKIGKGYKRKTGRKAKVGATYTTQGNRTWKKTKKGWKRQKKKRR